MVELKANEKLWKVDQGDIDGWIKESHELAESFVYDPLILKAVQEPGQLAPINVPTSYMKEAGAIRGSGSWLLVCGLVGCCTKPNRQMKTRFQCRDSTEKLHS